MEPRVIIHTESSGSGLSSDVTGRIQRSLAHDSRWYVLDGDWLKQKALAQYKQCCRQHAINILDQSVAPTGSEGKTQPRSR